MRQAHETLNKRCLGGNPEASSWRDVKQALLGRQPKEFFPAFCIFNSINAINSIHVILFTTLLKLCFIITAVVYYLVHANTIIGKSAAVR
jgi:hypothetical protein